MAGHSHASNVKHKKEATDKKRSKLFTKLVRDITSCVRQGGPIPENNPKLRMILEHARRLNLPKENIDRAIKKGSDPANIDEMEDVQYEGFIPGGIAFIVEACTDNRNRTASKVKEIFRKFDGDLGACSYLFQHIGKIKYKKSADIMMKAIEANALDVLEYDKEIEIIVEPNNFYQVQEKCGEALNSEIVYEAVAEISVDQDKMAKIKKMLELFEDNDDVQDVWCNVNLSSDLSSD